MLGERLAEARTLCGMRQIDLAVALGCSQSMISMAETGATQFGLEVLIAAAKELGVSIDYLTGLADDPTPAAALVAELARLRADGADPVRLTWALEEAERALSTRRRTPQPSEKAKLAVKFYTGDDPSVQARARVARRILRQLEGARRA